MSSVHSSNPRKSGRSGSRSTLQKLVDAAGAQKHGCTWSHVLQYLKAHADVSEAHEGRDLGFESPLQTYYTANAKLQSELHMDDSGHSILKSCVAVGAPRKIIAALCHLGPTSLQKPDLQGRLLLHTVCRYPDMPDKVLLLLVNAYPAALLYRDDQGRTPLHYLMWYHCDQRSSSIVDLFCQNLTNHKVAKKVFQNQVSQGKPLPKLYQNKLHASVIPDAVFGSLPIHYAVMHGASKATLTVLLQHLPVSKHAMDRHGRTPLHWYVGAGIPMHEEVLVHVTGEETKLDESSAPYYQQRIDPEIVSLLLSSRVARTVDRFERTILHCFCKLAAHKLLHGEAVEVDIIHRLLGAFAGQLSAKDIHGKTPAVVLLDTIYYIQKRRWESGNRSELRFDLPMELVHILFSKDPKVSKLEDTSGRLPIHAALAVGASPTVVSLLIEQHPNSLMHMDEQLQVPLHAALRQPWSANLQSREAIDSLLSKQYERQGTVVDGRLAMKMEDSDGYYPIHYACSKGAPFEVIQCMVEKYARCAMLQTPVGDLPVHCLLLENEAVIVDALESKNTERFSACRDKLQVLLRPLLSGPEKLCVADSRRGMLPLHIAVLFEAVEYPVLLRMLELYPEGGMHFTSNLFLEMREKTPLTCSPIDLHEIRRQYEDKNKLQDWHSVRELLFSFSPTLESHRHREELLERCVHIVVNELNVTTQGLSFHLQANNDKEKQPPDIEITHTVSAMEADLQGSSSFGSRTNQRRRRGNHLSRILSPNKSRYNPHSRTRTRTRTRQVGSDPSGGEAPEPIRNRVARLTAASSSMYDEEDTGFDTYDTGDRDDATSCADTADDGDESRISGTDDAGTSTEDDCTSGTGTGTLGDDSRTIGYSTSGSRFPTTFEDASSGSSDESDSFDQETQSSLSQNGQSHSYEGSTIDGSRSGLSRRTYSYEGSTAGRSTHGQTSFDESDDESHEVVFDRLKQKASGEEKKEEEIQNLDDSILTPRFSNHRNKPEDAFQRPSYMSEVAMRLWTFFVLYCDPNNPGDHYAKQVAEIMDEVTFSTLQRLVSNPLPPYAENYLSLEKGTGGLRFIDVASPKCRELIHKTGYFLGRYEFVGKDILVQRIENDTSIILEASEWLFTTEEVTDAKKPGMAEENIWATGEVPAEVNVTFRSKKRPVWIKFTKSLAIFNNEIKSREILCAAVDDQSDQPRVPHVAGVLRHFNAFATDRKADRVYKIQISDKRFNTLSLFGNSEAEGETKVVLDQYPYAVVFNEPPRGTLHEYYQRNGIASLSETVAILNQIAESLEQLHTKGLCCGDVCMKNIVSLNKGHDERSCPWGLFDLSCTSPIGENGGMLGGVDESGRPRFHTDTLPPEMFCRVSPVGLKRYQTYWDSIEKKFNIRVDPQIKNPVVDAGNGAIYVVKCHFDSRSMNQDDQVSLPYKLVAPSASVDVWAFGCLLFQLLTGRCLFPVSIRERQLLDYGMVCNFAAEPTVYEDVSDPVAQDLLINCLSAKADREKLSMGDILQHPFFCDRSSLPEAVRDHHISQTAALGRKKTNLFRDRYEKGILEQKTRGIACWDFDALERFHQAPTQIVRSLSEQSAAGVIPCGLLPLPFECISEKKSHKTIAERLGRELLQLSKVCFFASVMEQTTSRKKTLRGKPWSESETTRVLDLSSSEFGSIQSQMADLAAKHVEAFRTDPMSIARQLVQQRLRDVLEMFESQDVRLYFLDEYSGDTIDKPPILVPDGWRDNVSRGGFLFLFLSSLYVRGLAGSTTGLARLFRLDTVPETWKVAATGLAHILDGDYFVNELRVLEQAMGDLLQSPYSIQTDSLNTMNDFLQDVGYDQAVEGLFRVVVGGEACLWVGADSVKELEQSQTPFKEALKKYRSRNCP